MPIISNSASLAPTGHQILLHEKTSPIQKMWLVILHKYQRYLVKRALHWLPSSWPAIGLCYVRLFPHENAPRVEGLNQAS